MRKIFISDISMRMGEGAALSFREKIELAKVLDKLGADCIECAPIEKVKIDSLLIKSIASAVNSAAVAVPVGIDAGAVETVWNALREAKKPRLQVVAPVSSVQMEYFYHKKPAAMMAAVSEVVALCAAKGCEVEFIAEDACRADSDFLYEIVAAAIAAGAAVVTVCDTEGAKLPNEIAEFVSELRANVPTLENVRLGVKCANDLAMADTASIAAIRCGAGEVKTCCSGDTADMANVARILAARGESMDAWSSVRTTELSRGIAQIRRMFHGKSDGKTEAVKTDGSDLVVSVHDDVSAVARAVAALGYELSDEDVTRVFEAVRRIGKEKVSAKELDAIVATAALQVPPTYRVDSYMINSASSMKSVAQIKLIKDDKPLEGVFAGDGPIDAAFIAIEQIIGCHYELDEFQIQAITEGREAMGETVVKLRSGGKLYSGRGISTDIIGASIRAYVNAVNKIVYEEGNE
ncbi:MAG: hypothetical protein IJY96_02770 [Oscillospiraceae bacterium]|nr:hypothetical protein [Oscillospiraceae bacterium]